MMMMMIMKAKLKVKKSNKNWKIFIVTEFIQNDAFIVHIIDPKYDDDYADDDEENNFVQSKARVREQGRESREK